MDVNATDAITVKRGMLSSKLRRHAPNTPVTLVDMMLCDVLRQANRSNIYAHGLHTVSWQDLDNQTYVAAEKPRLLVHVTLPASHPRGTFWYTIVCVCARARAGLCVCVCVCVCVVSE